MQYRFAAFDLDGTLLNDKKELTPRTERAVRKLQRLGVRVILASGRHPCGVLPLCKRLGLAEAGGMALCFNGGSVVDCASGKRLVRYPLARETAVDVVAAAKALGLHPMAYRERSLLTQTPENEYVQLESMIGNLEIEVCPMEAADLPEVVDKLLLVQSPEYVAKVLPDLQRRFAGRCDICCSAPYFIEVMPCGIHKAVALRELMEQFGADGGALVAFGDGQNDISMLEYAGLGVAMGNAPEDVKAHAQLVTGSCNADGVADAIERIWPETLGMLDFPGDARYTV